jgi:restriction endonuclease S subunit
MVKLGEVVIDMKDGGTPSRSKPEYFGGNVNWAVVKDIVPEIYATKEKLTDAGLKNSSAKVWPVDSVVISLGATIGNVGVAKVPVATKQGLSGIVVDKDKILPKYLYYVLVSQREFIQSQATGASIKEVRPSKLQEILSIPLPPLEIQQQIVAELDGYSAIIAGAKQVTENWKPKIDIDPTWEKKSLDELCELSSGGTPPVRTPEYWNGEIPWYSSGELNEQFTTDSKKQISQKGIDNSNAKVFPKGSLLIGMYDTAALKMSLLDRAASFNQAIAGVKPSKHISMEFLKLFLEHNREYYMSQRNGVRQRNLSLGFFKELIISFPSLTIQKQIVEKIEAERTLVESTKKLIAIYEQKIKATIAKLWK